MVNWYKEIPLFDFLSGPCELGGIERKTSHLSTICRHFVDKTRRLWVEYGRKRPETAGEGRIRQKKEMVFEVEWLFWGMQVSVGGLEGT